MHLRTAPTIPTKHLDALIHSTTSSLMALGGRSDIVHYHGLGPALVSPLPKYFSRAQVVLTVHGLDHQRAKWGRAAQGLMSTGHWMSHHIPDQTIAVSHDLRHHYHEEFGRPCAYIPNGVQQQAVPAPDTLNELGVRPGQYVLFVGRLVPEKRPDLLVNAFATLRTSQRLVLAGGTSFTPEYVAHLAALAARDPRVIMPGYLYGEQLTALYHYASAFVLPSALEGLPLTLLEAAAAGSPVIASDIAPHLEVLGAGGAPGRRLFREGDEEDLARVLAQVLDSPDVESDGARALQADVLANYSWDSAVDALETLYYQALGTPRTRSLPRQRPTSGAA
jgi:glycosyltransferase involved in cell wall biosynthesis